MRNEFRRHDEFTEFVYANVPDFPKKITRRDLIALADLFFGENNYYLHTISDALEKLKRDGAIFIPERGLYARPTDFRQMAHAFRRKARPVTRRSLLLAEEVKEERLRKQLRKVLSTQRQILGTSGKPKLGRPPKQSPPPAQQTRRIKDPVNRKDASSREEKGNKFVETS